MTKTQAIVPAEKVESRILLIRGHKVMLDSDLTWLYGVATKALVQATKRNRERFPQDFMFQLSRQEFKILRSQPVTSSRWDGRRYPPYAFTEQAVAMLSSVLREQTGRAGEYSDHADLRPCGACWPPTLNCTGVWTISKRSTTNSSKSSSMRFAS